MHQKSSLVAFEAVKSLEERLSLAQSRLTRAETAASQALSQVRQLETSLQSLQVEEQPAFQSLSREVRRISKANGSRHVSRSLLLVAVWACEASAESLTDLQAVVYGLERSFCELTWQQAAKRSGSFGCQVGPTSREVHSEVAPEPREDVPEGLHFADGTVESIRPRARESSAAK